MLTIRLGKEKVNSLIISFLDYFISKSIEVYHFSYVVYGKYYRESKVTLDCVNIIKYDSMYLVVTTYRNLCIIYIMSIMRSSKNRSIFMECVEKVKRQRVDWVKILNKLNHNELFATYFRYLRKLWHGKPMSFNRAAYYSLKSHYSTTTIAQLLEKLGL